MTPTSPPAGMRLQSRSSVFLVVCGVVVGMVAAGLGIPFIFGKPLSSNQGPGISQLHTAAGTTTPAGGAAATTPGGPAGAGGAGLAGGSALDSGSGGPAGATGAGAGPGGLAAGGAGAGSATGGGGGSLTSGSGAPATPLTSSDVGVTPTSIKVGVLLIDLGGVGRLGFGIPGFDPKTEQGFYSAFIDRINAGGGVLGRKIVPDFITYDPTQESIMDAACLKATQDDHDFAVLDGGGVSGTAQLCVTDQNATPLVTVGAVGTPEGFYQQGRGRLFTLFESGMRSMSNMAWFLNQHGYLKGKTLGILDDTSPGDAQTVTDSAVAVLSKLGYKIAYRADMSSDASTEQSQTPVAVQQMRAHGVNAIFLLTGLVETTEFVQAAANSGYAPAYFATDWQSQTADLAVENMPSSFQAVAVTTIRLGEWRVNMGDSAVDQQCRQTYNQASGSSYDPSNSNYEALMFSCGLVNMFSEAAGKAGADLTRSGLTGALEGLGNLALPYFGSGSFHAGKYDAGDSVRTLRFQYGCKCWEPIDAFVPPQY